MLSPGRLAATRWAGTLILLLLMLTSVSCQNVDFPGSKMPTELEKPGVLTGDGLFKVRDFVTSQKLGEVTDLVIADADSKIGVAGTHGVMWLDFEGKELSQVSFGDVATRVEIIDVENDGVYEYLDRGGDGWADSALLDSSGKVLWAFGSRSGRSLAAVDDMAAGDLDGDGVLEFVVGHNGDGGVQFLESDGKPGWVQSDGNVWHVEIVDIDSDGQAEVVHSSAGGEITVRDRTGAVLKITNAPAYFSDFSLCNWPQADSPPKLIYSESDTIWVVDFDGTVIKKFDAPHAGTIGNAKATHATLRQGEPASLAVIVEFMNWDRSVLYVFDSTGAIVYQEVIGERCCSIAARRNAATKTDSILVGGTGRVMEYEISK